MSGEGLTEQIVVPEGPVKSQKWNQGEKTIMNSMQHASKVFQLFCALLVPSASYAQINSGSDGRDGVFEPTTSIEVDMSDHPTGIYHYTRVNIPAGVKVTFRPNERNTPVIWLVQTECRIKGAIDLSGGDGSLAQNGAFGGLPGPGGFSGGNGARSGDNGPSEGAGPGGGKPGAVTAGRFDTYGNAFLLPLVGGSGGAGGSAARVMGGGGGGGGAILIAANELIEINGSLQSSGGNAGRVDFTDGGGGSGGAIRLVSANLTGNGLITTQFGQPSVGVNGNGRVRIDALYDRFLGGIESTQVSRGFNSIILQPASPAPKITILSLAGVNVVEDPQGRLASPDLVLPAQIDGRLAVVVRCENLPLGSEVTVDAKPVSGLGARAVGRNTVGKIESSTATLTLDLPRGVGTIMARAVASVASPNGQSLKTGGASTTKTKGEGAAVAPKGTASLADIPYSVTGLTTDGERIAAIEAEGTLGGPSRTVYVTESGKRISTPPAR